MVEHISLLEGSRLVGSLALHGLQKFTDLNQSVTPDERRRNLLFVDSDPAYSSALDRVLTASQRLQPRSIASLIGFALRGAGLEEIIMRAAVETVVRGEVKDKVATTLFEAYNPMVDALPNAIDKWLKEGGVEQWLMDYLQKVADGIRRGDVMLKTKILVDAVRIDFDKYGIDFSTWRVFIRAMIEYYIPGARNIRPENIDIGVLENLQNYGLMEFLPVNGYFHLEASTNGYGDAYKRNVIDAYRGKPKSDAVSAEPYSERVRKWEQEKKDYGESKALIVRVLSSFEQHYETRGLGRGYDIVWLRKNLPRIREETESILDSRATANIVSFSRYPRVESFEWSKLRGGANFAEVIVAIKTAFEFASNNDTTCADEILQLAMLAFKDMMMGLYNIEGNDRWVSFS